MIAYKDLGGIQLKHLINSMQYNKAAISFCFIIVSNKGFCICVH